MYECDFHEFGRQGKVIYCYLQLPWIHSFGFEMFTRMHILTCIDENTRLFRDTSDFEAGDQHAINRIAAHVFIGNWEGVKVTVSAYEASRLAPSYIEDC